MFMGLNITNFLILFTSAWKSILKLFIVANTLKFKTTNENYVRVSNVEKKMSDSEKPFLLGVIGTKKEEIRPSFQVTI